MLKLCNHCMQKTQRLPEGTEWTYTCGHCFERYKEEYKPTPKICGYCADGNGRCQTCLRKLEQAKEQTTLI